MASRAAAERWLEKLTNLPTASGKEGAVVDWVARWAARRPDLGIVTDSGGNLIITQRRRSKRAPVFAVAHMDHPAFVAEAADGRMVHYEFRGGVNAEYFENARVEFLAGSVWVQGQVVDHGLRPEPGRFGSMSIGKVRLDRAVQVAAGSIGRWVFPKRASVQDRFRAPACDDLAGVAAALAALDRCRAMPELGHFGVLLTRAEEVGLVGAIHAAREGSIPDNSRMLSIETSRELPNARIGDGPIIRVGDAVTIFDAELTNRIAAGARGAGIKHQRKLMDGGGCEATAFAAYGYQSSGLCLALGNWHNRGNLEAVEAGTGRATPELEEISLEDFHDLVRLLLVAAESADHPVGSRSELERSYQRSRRYLG